MQNCPNPEAHTDQLAVFGECTWCLTVKPGAAELPLDILMVLGDPEATDADIEYEIDLAGWSVDVQDAVRNSEPEDSRLRFVLNKRLANMYGR